MSRKQLEPETPLERFKATYTPLYRVLLVLAALSVVISLPGVLNLRRILDILPSDPLYAASGLVSIFVVLPLMISSLFLLVQKHPAGIHIRLGGYAAAIIASILGMFTSQETIKSVAQSALENAQKSADITPEFALQVTEFSYFAALYFSVIISVLFAWLWWKAWKKQIRVDAKKQSK